MEEVLNNPELRKLWGKVILQVAIKEWNLPGAISGFVLQIDNLNNFNSRDKAKKIANAFYRANPYLSRPWNIDQSVIRNIVEREVSELNKINQNNAPGQNEQEYEH